MSCGMRECELWYEIERDFGMRQSESCGMR